MICGALPSRYCWVSVSLPVLLQRLPLPGKPATRSHARKTVSPSAPAALAPRAAWGSAGPRNRLAWHRGRIPELAGRNSRFACDAVSCNAADGDAGSRRLNWRSLASITTRCLPYRSISLQSFPDGFTRNQPLAIIIGVLERGDGKWRSFFRSSAAPDYGKRGPHADTSLRRVQE